jgi:hypothetical protein
MRRRAVYGGFCLFGGIPRVGLCVCACWAPLVLGPGFLSWRAAYLGHACVEVMLIQLDGDNPSPL